MTEPPSPSPLIIRHLLCNDPPERLHFSCTPFHDLAVALDNTLPDNAERAEAIRKVLEAEDAARRSLASKIRTSPQEPPMD